MTKRSELIAREGFRFIIPLLAMTILSSAMGMNIVSGIFLFLTCFVLWFFRNPERTGPNDEKSVISPADGKVIKIEELEDTGFIQERCIKISIFMNIFDVHVNRIPFSGTIENITYKKGAFISANLDKASEKNERNIVLLRTSTGRKILFIQIAGLIARRIVCWIDKGMDLTRGERYGLICFGSRLELFIPSDSTVVVKVGDRVRAGSTVMGYLK
jgi:phosphatidylserine decarboxylase